MRVHGAPYTFRSNATLRQILFDSSTLRSRTTLLFSTVKLPEEGAEYLLLPFGLEDSVFKDSTEENCFKLTRQIHIAKRKMHSFRDSKDLFDIDHISLLLFVVYVLLIYYLG